MLQADSALASHLARPLPVLAQAYTPSASQDGYTQGQPALQRWVFLGKRQRSERGQTAKKLT